ncbi:unnamed protein product, partial [Cuscuta epithymum]
MLFSWILASLTESLHARVIQCRHSHQLWSELHIFFRSHIIARARQLKSELYNTSKGDRSITDYLLRIQHIVENLTAVGEPISSKDHINVILEGLPEEYEALVSSVSSRSILDPVTLSELEGLLLAKELRVRKQRESSQQSLLSANVARLEISSQTDDTTAQNSTENSSAYVAQFPNSNNNVSFRGRGRGGSFRGRGGRSGGRSSVVCQVCGKSNHTALVCYHRFNPTYTASVPSALPGAVTGTSQSSYPQQFNPYTPQPSYFPQNQNWGHPSSQTPNAFYQMPQTPANSLPHSYTPQTTWNQQSQQYVPTAAWASTNSSILGPHPQSANWFPDSGATHHVTADPLNLQHSEPAITTDKLFMGNGQGLDIKSIGFSSFSSPYNPSYTLFLNKILHVPSITKNLLSVSQFAKDNRVFFEFHPLGADGLYKFQSLPAFGLCQSASPNKSCNNIQSCNSSISCNQWHLRLGHPHLEALKSVLKHCNVPTINKSELDFCSSCCLGKVHRLPSSPSTTIFQSPFELIFTDLWGPAPVLSFDGYSYYISFIDAFTRYTWIYFLKKKSDALIAFQNFYQYILNQFSVSIKAVQSDWGGEFRSFTNFLIEKGITHRIICPHTHHQNGVVERKHRTIVEKGLSLLAHSSLPHKFWDTAFATSVHLANRTPSKSIANSSPYFKLYGSIPDYSFLRVFGCSCFPFLRPYNKHKMDFHSEECVFIGYSTQHKGYKCLSPSGRVYISKDVVFNESKFPYPTLFNSTNNHSHTTSPPQSAPLTISQPNSQSNSTSSSNTLSSSQTESSQSIPIHTPLQSQSSPSESNSQANLPSHSSSSSSAPITSSSSSSPVIPLTNTHPMKTRAKFGIVKPRLHPTLLLAHVEPTSVKQALSSPQWFA